MAISIDIVYQRVLALANKEQRGYITPQEFNLFANQAQMEILDQYFYDLNQFERIPGNDTEYGDMISLLKEKIGTLEKSSSISWSTTTSSWPLPVDLYRLGSINNSTGIEAQEVDIKTYNRAIQTTLIQPGANNILFYYKGPDAVFIHGVGTQGYVCNYIKKPAIPKWGYVVISKKALYDPTPTKTTHFELHASEETELVYRILTLAGITLNKPGLAQSAINLQTSTVQQQKQ